MEMASPEMIEEFEQLVTDLNELFYKKSIDNIIPLLTSFLAEAGVSYGVDREELIKFVTDSINELYLQETIKQ